MNLYKGNPDAKTHEQLVKTECQEITHLVVKAGQEIPKHAHPWHVVVVIYKGKVNFSNESKSEELIPGKIITLEPNETHGLVAVEDSALMVIKSKLMDA